MGAVNRVATPLDLPPLMKEENDLVLPDVHRALELEVVVVEKLRPVRGQATQPVVSPVDPILQPLRRGDPFEVRVEELESRLNAIVVEGVDRAQQGSGPLLRHARSIAN